MDLPVALAIRTAARSLCRYRISAIMLDNKGKVLSTAHNLPRMAKKGGGIHAELEAIKRCNLAKAHAILLIRLGKNGTLRPIEPCPSCQRLISKLGLRLIYARDN